MSSAQSSHAREQHGRSSHTPSQNHDATQPHVVPKMADPVSREDSTGIELVLNLVVGIFLQLRTVASLLVLDIEAIRAVPVLGHVGVLARGGLVHKSALMSFHISIAVI